MSVDTLPVPEHCHRLLGLEIEIDALGARSHDFVIPDGWSRIHDASLRNGYEYILSAPLAAGSLLPAVQSFSAVTHGIVYAAKTGSYHVHVSAPDYTAGDVARLCRIYSHFQEAIDQLVADSRKSRARNQYCMPLPPHTEINIDWARTFYTLNDTVSSRSSAKGNRPRCVVNACMLRCDTPSHRSIEFRQQSVTTNLKALYGWALLCAGLVDFCRNAQNTRPFLRGRPSFERFLVMLRRIGRTGSVKGLEEWAQWRVSYLTELPKNLDQSAAMAKMASRPRGLFTVARLLNVNNAVALAWLRLQIQQGNVVTVGNRYQMHHSAVAAGELEIMRRQWATEVSVETQEIASPSTLPQLQISQDSGQGVGDRPATAVV